MEDEEDTAKGGDFGFGAAKFTVCTLGFALTWTNGCSSGTSVSHADIAEPEKKFDLATRENDI